MKSEKENAEIRLSDPLQYQSIVDAEWNIIYDKLDKCVKSGAKIVLSRLAIGDLATQYFADRDILCARRVTEEDLQRVATATGGTVQTSVNNVVDDVLGSCEVFEEKQVGNERNANFDKLHLICTVDRNSESRLKYICHGGTLGTRMVRADAAAINLDRRLHQLLNEHEESESRADHATAIPVQEWGQRRYSVVTVRCRDRPKLLSPPSMRRASRLLHIDLAWNVLAGMLPLLPPTLRYLSVAGDTMEGTLEGPSALVKLEMVTMPVRPYLPTRRPTSVVLAGLLATLKMVRGTLTEQTYLFLSAGE
uniref:CCT-eta n=1 Tax=Zea mays TaxID=4577 RepID=A0A804RGF8_MAIZE